MAAQDERIAELEDMLQQLHERLHAVEQRLGMAERAEISDLLFGDGWVEDARKASGWGSGDRTRKGSRG